MWHGIYEKWIPLEAWSDCRVEIDAVHDDWEGFRIWVRNYDGTYGMLIVRFEQPLFYCSSDESDRIEKVSPPQPGLKFPHVFWRVGDSELIDLFNRQSCGVHANTGSGTLVHYAFLSCNGCVDVISALPPEFSGDVAGPGKST